MENDSISAPKDAPLEYITSIASAFLPQSPVIFRYYLQGLARELLPAQRTAFCLRRIVPKKEYVAVVRNPQTRKTHYKNLIVCGSVWQCPVCAAQITETRRRELSAALAVSDLTPVLITYTVRHNQGMRLAELLDAVLNAYRSFKGRRAFTNLRDEFGWVGSVRSLEVTYGVNGWHPHIHELALLERKLTKAQQSGLERQIKALWGVCLQKFGYSASWEHGVDVEGRDVNIREYVAKFGYEPEPATNWTLEHELTKSPVKRGRGEGRTPTQLLADYGDGDIAAGRLWKEYARCFKGRNQLVWSRDLRDLLGMGGEKSDAAIAAEEGKKHPEIARLYADQLRALLRADMRGELQDYSTKHTDEEFSIWLADLLSRWQQPIVTP